jgi:hypothetical protein
MRRRVVGRVFIDVSEDCSAYIFQCQAVQPHSITYQKNTNFGNTTVITLNLKVIYRQVP